MALQELGTKLTAALSRINRTATVDEETLKEVVTDICKALLQSDVNVRVVKQLREEVVSRLALEDSEEGGNPSRRVERVVFESLVKLVDPGKDPYKIRKGQPNVVMFVGLQGAGKTTTVAKYAHYCKQRRFKTAMVCADTFRAGAFDQLKQNAQRLSVPYYGSYTEADPVEIARKGVELFRQEGFDVIIVDTSGRHRQEAALFEEMEDVAAAVRPDEVILVMDSSIGQAAHSQAAAFRDSVSVGSVIMTKMDGHAKGGGALSAVAATGSPITFIGVGEHFNDLDPFDAPGFVSQLLGRGNVRGIYQRFQEVVDKEDSERMMKKLSKGMFTMRDMREQFEMIMRMGSVGKMAQMLPGGLSQMFDNMPGDQDPSDRLRRFLVMMDSMTDKELDGKVPIDLSRAERIAQGSGMALEEVGMVLRVHKQFEKMIGKMGKSGMMKGGDAGFAERMQRNPKQMREQLAKSMDPRMLQQMGGAGGVMEMMKQFSGADMSQMQEVMGGMLGGGGMPGMMGGRGRGRGRGGGRRR